MHEWLQRAKNRLGRNRTNGSEGKENGSRPSHFVLTETDSVGTVLRKISLSIGESYPLPPGEGSNPNEQMTSFTVTPDSPSNLRITCAFAGSNFTWRWQSEVVPPEKDGDDPQTRIVASLKDAAFEKIKGTDIRDKSANIDGSSVRVREMQLIGPSWDIQFVPEPN